MEDGRRKIGDTSKREIAAMGKAGGFILRLPAQRREEFERSLYLYGTFAEPVLEFEHNRNSALVCFVIEHDGRITHIASGKRGTRSGSGLRRLNIMSVEKITPNIKIGDILANIPSRSVASIRNRLENSGLLPPKAFENFIDTLIRIAPHTKPFIERFGQERRARIAALSPKVSSALAEQKEAVATALSLARIDRTPLQSWSPTSAAAPQSFIEGLSSARLREDPMIINDLSQFPGHDLISRTPYAAAMFQGERSRITVILANRLPLEETFGTDLIYYNETFKSFLMVQYKAMEREHDEDVFRLPDDNLTKELRRMDGVLAQLQACAPDAGREAFRLTQNPFFLKFCPRLIFNPDDSGLVHGMYIPLDYWKLTENHPELLGSRGGRLLTYKNVGRYFDNSSFVGMVANAWIGTTVTQSSALEPIIREIIESGRAVAVAIKKDRDPFAGVRGHVSDYNPVDGTNNEAEDVEDHLVVRITED